MHLVPFPVTHHMDLLVARDYYLDLGIRMPMEINNLTHEVFRLLDLSRIPNSVGFSGRTASYSSTSNDQVPDSMVRDRLRRMSRSISVSRSATDRQWRLGNFSVSQTSCAVQCRVSGSNWRRGSRSRSRSSVERATHA